MELVLELLLRSVLKLYALMIVDHHLNGDQLHLHLHHCGDHDLFKQSMINVEIPLLLQQTHQNA